MNKRRQVFQMDGFEITIQLPKDYGKQKVKRYAALIVHDGDMLFKRCNKDMIFIGILSKERAKDFTPWPAKVGTRLNQGQASRYLTWLTTQLLPYVREQYRVSLNNQDIGIAGASYGGLVSLYALYTMPQQFGKYILISPSVWYPEFIDFMKQQQTINASVHVYWYVGMKEGIKHTQIVKDMVGNSLLGKAILANDLANETSTFKFQTAKRGIHRQRYFKKFFKRGLKEVF
ncbi:alpha/beta hydrolase-fold protein [Staphylococcus lugdunensis]|uniref:alpha/beta hydrolase n=1 Tax=Staphylococcus lugdunensis TaxID=28035 RepID=UPI00045B2351|nr:alpha/beta hydrolase-fold protein [Staphylococcus lugdunensis]KAK58353.1 putative esterase [Staphylococcus lugdunensis VCU150]MCI2844787.1 alpha/beta hydrolase-fold protein [Staphylococcus lugdunensis]MDU4769035.1 alpha/beta hydrolase-fold protein [Staphylococcus lugdunensis]